MTTSRSVGEVLEALSVPMARAAGWDAVGLQIGDRAALVTALGVCHEITDEIVAAAVDGGLDLLVTYHPLIFHPLSSLVAGRGPGGRSYRLAAAGVSVISVHTGWDVAPGGSADALAAAFGLTDVAPFGPLWGADSVEIVTFVPESHADAVVAAMAGAGAGRIGEYSGCSFRTPGQGVFAASDSSNPHTGAAGSVTATDETRVEMSAPAASLSSVVAALVTAHPYEEPAWDVYQRRGSAGFLGRTGLLPDAPVSLGDLAGTVREILGTEPRVAGASDHRVSRLAVLPGSGGDFMALVASTGADAVVTGDVTHHRARAALDSGVAVLDPGHAPTERPGLTTLYAAVCDIVPEAVDLGHIDPDPWRQPA